MALSSKEVHQLVSNCACYIRKEYNSFIILYAGTLHIESTKEY